MRSFRWSAAAVVTAAVVTQFHVRAAEKPTTPAPVQAAAQNSHHEHGDWWCAEHGVPEDVCSQCSPKVAAQCKKKGDWCKEHDRAMSQCFVCHPEYKEKFAAKFRAKYGKEPPPTADDEKKKGG